MCGCEGGYDITVQLRGGWRCGPRSCEACGDAACAAVMGAVTWSMQLQGAYAAPAPTEGTASVKLIGVAEKAAAAEPEALVLRAESMAWRQLRCGCRRCHEIVVSRSLLSCCVVL